MVTAIIVFIVVGAVLFGITYNVLKSAKTGMPPQDVLDRATRRARELEEQEKNEQGGRDA